MSYLRNPDRTGASPGATQGANQGATHGHQSVYREDYRKRFGPRRARRSAMVISRSMSSTCWPRCSNRKAGWRRRSSPRPASMWKSLTQRLDQELDRLPKVSGPSRRARPDLRHARGSTACSRRPRTRPKSSKTSTSRWSTCCWLPRRQRLDRPHLERIRAHARPADAGAAGSARQPARDLAESGSHLRSAGKIRPRPDQTGGAGQARSGDRPRRRDPPRDPGALAAHEEQSRADRRAGRRQDRDRRGPGAAHCARRRARRPEEQDGSSRSTWAR